MIEDPKESLHRALVFGSRDWAASERDAWVYGVIVGWSGESIEELADTFGWTAETKARLRRLHDAFKELT